MKAKDIITRAFGLSFGTTFLVPGVLLLLFGVSEWRTDPIVGGGIRLPYLPYLGHEMTGQILVVAGALLLVLGILCFMLYFSTANQLDHNKSIQPSAFGRG